VRRFNQIGWLIAALKRLASAVQLRPWPPSFTMDPWFGRSVISSLPLEACLVQSSEKLVLVAMVFAKCCEADLKISTAVV
jgi:hypothetical protein